VSLRSLPNLSYRDLPFFSTYRSQSPLDILFLSYFFVTTFYARRGSISNLFTCIPSVAPRHLGEWNSRCCESKSMTCEMSLNVPMQEGFRPANESWLIWVDLISLLFYRPFGSQKLERCHRRDQAARTRILLATKTTSSRPSCSLTASTSASDRSRKRRPGCACVLNLFFCAYSSWHSVYCLYATHHC
jgi:hypothetical protein